VTTYRRKICAGDAANLSIRNDTVYLDGEPVNEVEMCGVIVSVREKAVDFYDFSGFMSLLKSSELVLQPGSCRIFARVFIKRGAPLVFCASARPVAIFEEMLHSLEVIASPRK